MEMIKLTINGREVTGKKGDTILTIAAQNGIEIPNLCYNKNLKIYGSCGLCVVEAEKSQAAARLRYRCCRRHGDLHPFRARNAGP